MMIGDKLTLGRIYGKEFTKAWIDEAGTVHVEMVDAPPPPAKLMTPKERARVSMMGVFAREFGETAEFLTMKGIEDDRADILTKSTERQGGLLRRSSDPLGQRYIHMVDLADLLKP